MPIRPREHRHVLVRSTGARLGEVDMQLWVVQYHKFPSSDLIVAMLGPKCFADLMGGLPTPDS